MGLDHGYAGPRIIKSGLVCNLDMGNLYSYPSGGAIWRDTLGNYNFTLKNSPNYTVNQGQLCLTLDAADDYLLFSGSLSHDIGTTCTLSFIMAGQDASFNSCKRLFSMTDSRTANYDFAEYMCLASCDTTQFGLWYRNSVGGFGGSYPGVDLRSSAYKHYVVTWNTNTDTFLIYVNGTLRSTTTSGIDPFNYTSITRMAIGQNACECITEYSPIRIASVQIYNRALSATEVAANYNAFKGKYSLS